MSKQTRNTLLLVLCAFIWGSAFVAQSIGAGLGAFTFLACRSWLAPIVLLPTIWVFDALHRRQGADYGWPKTRQEWHDLLEASVVCGTILFLASASQQFAITLDPSTAKAGFITAMYVVLVPVVSLAFGKKNSFQLWGCVALSVLGLYLLCMSGGFGTIGTSDLFLMLCALLFSFQILAVAHYGPHLDGIRLSLLQFIVVALWSTAAAFLFEVPSLPAIQSNLWPVVYCGFFSSGVAYTLQILGERDVNPAIASLAMCLESVFGALGGWVILHQSLTVRELLGCCLIFIAVVAAQLPLESWLRRRHQTT